MFLGKEYPATHSMETSWFAIDEEDNVALFEGYENGPIPNGMKQDHYIEEKELVKPHDLTLTLSSYEVEKLKKKENETNR